MDTTLLTASIVLAAVFAVAAFAKLLDLNGSREAARSFGVPSWLAGAVGVGLPVVELAIAVLIVATPTRLYAALGALALLLVLCAAIAVAMARGRAPDCHCFGQLHSAPAGWRTLARNGALASLAAFVAVGARTDPGTGAVDWVGGLHGAEWIALALGLALIALTAVGGFVLLHLLRSYGHVLTRLDRVEERLRAAGLELEEPDEIPQLGLTPGTRAPEFWLPSVDGDRVALGDLLQPGRPLLLLFTSPSCGPCSVLMPTVAEWQQDHADELTVALLSDGDEELIRAEAAEHGLEHVLVDETLSAYEAYEANGTPSAVLVGDDGTIASWLAAGSEWITSLFEEALHGRGHTPGLPVGSEGPSLQLESLEGEKTAFAELVTGPTVVLFWNPGCGYCRAMHDDVRRWEEAPPSGAPALVVMSAGTPEEVRQEGFTSQVLLDAEWRASGAFGADGTPMAVLVDGDGRVATPLVTGARAVLELLGAGELSVA